jgi:hypothetical protein
MIEMPEKQDKRASYFAAIFLVTVIAGGIYSCFTFGRLGFLFAVAVAFIIALLWKIWALNFYTCPACGTRLECYPSHDPSERDLRHRCKKCNVLWNCKFDILFSSSD